MTSWRHRTTIDDDGKSVKIGFGTLPGGVTVGGTAETTIVSITDDDTADLVVSPSSLDIGEAGSGTFTVKLATQPSLAVTVSVTSGDTGAATVSQASLSFSAATWNDAQTVTVSGVSDADTSDESLSVTLEAGSTDVKLYQMVIYNLDLIEYFPNEGTSWRSRLLIQESLKAEFNVLRCGVVPVMEFDTLSKVNRQRKAVVRPTPLLGKTSHGHSTRSLRSMPNRGMWKRRRCSLSSTVANIGSTASVANPALATTSSSICFATTTGSVVAIPAVVGVGVVAAVPAVVGVGVVAAVPAVVGVGVAVGPSSSPQAAAINASATSNVKMRIPPPNEPRPTNLPFPLTRPRPLVRALRFISDLLPATKPITQWLQNQHRDVGRP